MLFTFTLGERSEAALCEALYNRYSGLMYHVAYGVLKDRHDAEDAVQEAFIHLFRNFDKVGQVASPRTRSLVVLITERRAIDLLRKKTANAADELTENSASVGLGSSHEGLAGVIASLPARYREALLLRYADGYSEIEVAQILGMRYDAARKLVERAREKLRKKLREEGTIV